MSDEDFVKIGVSFANQWIETVKKKRYEEIFGMLHENISFNSPVVHKRYTNRDEIQFILQNVLEIFHNFEYINSGYVTHSIIPKSKQQSLEKTENLIGVILLFKAEVMNEETGKLMQVEGVDIFEVNENGKAVYLKVMIRPLNALTQLAKQMMKRFANSSL